ncbi:MAG: VWA domain-containing protein, partial [Planctomycetes bacterium]|nr:VWA domain-containing protein [Planctomycetota bacterium]
MLVGQIVPFVNPELALAAGAVGAIPVLVHLINRRRYREVPWAAMSFLLAARRRSRRRVQLQHLLLMAMRIAAIVLLGLAVARPYTPASAAVPSRFARTHHLILLDNSLSMSATARAGVTRFESAKRWALDRLAAIPRTDSVSIVTLSKPAEALIGHEAYDRRIVRDRLAGIEPTQRATDSVGAVEHALRILRASTTAAGNRAIYLISDFPHNGWEDSDADADMPVVSSLKRLIDESLIPASQVHLVRTSEEEFANLAITSLAPASSLIIRQMPVLFDVEVFNFGSTTVRDAVLRVSRDGEIIRSDPLPPLEPGMSASSTITIAVED